MKWANAEIEVIMQLNTYQDLWQTKTFLKSFQSQGYSSVTVKRIRLEGPGSFSSAPLNRRTE